MKPAVHFVGFRGEEYWSAVRVWGKPGFIHVGNDNRMRREMADGDVVIYANGCEARPSDRNFSDLKPQDRENGV
ncbi:hypothetical protein GCM10008023_06160 [Sphingomonas glacialis]|uniref:Uncharacterized protein n=1 Tax=Sphingomonas glacialis TaxID=658225 RepID=A0ABQ3LBV2_9SPHN|nr:hypothetical protein [Sphingomonas glacialis]GHH09456.1 hypothetical protein GCM10008023_06160 [Sphingomonas glacialis]